MNLCSARGAEVHGELSKSPKSPESWRQNRLAQPRMGPWADPRRYPLQVQGFGHGCWLATYGGWLRNPAAFDGSSYRISIGFQWISMVQDFATIHSTTSYSTSFSPVLDVVGRQTPSFSGVSGCTPIVSKYAAIQAIQHACPDQFSKFYPSRWIAKSYVETSFGRTSWKDFSGCFETCRVTGHMINVFSRCISRIIINIHGNKYSQGMQRTSSIMLIREDSMENTSKFIDDE